MAIADFRSQLASGSMLVSFIDDANCWRALSRRTGGNEFVRECYLGLDVIWSNFLHCSPLF